MALVMSNSGSLELLNNMLKQTAVTSPYLLKLFNVSTLTPSAAMTTADFTGKTATFTNYSIATLSRAGWSSATSSSNTAVAVYNAAISWTCGATGDTVYGYIVESVDGSQVLWAEKFAVARALGSGDVINVTPKFTMTSA